MKMCLSESSFPVESSVHVIGSVQDKTGEVLRFVVKKNT